MLLFYLDIYIYIYIYIYIKYIIYTTCIGQFLIYLIISRNKMYFISVNIYNININNLVTS